MSGAMGAPGCTHGKGPNAGPRGASAEPEGRGEAAEAGLETPRGEDADS